MFLLLIFMCRSGQPSTGHRRLWFVRIQVQRWNMHWSKFAVWSSLSLPRWIGWRWMWWVTFYLLCCVMSRGVASIFGICADFCLAPPPDSEIHHAKFSKSPKLFTKFGQFKNNLNFQLGDLGDHLDPTFPYFWKIVSVFVDVGLPKRQLTMIFWGNRLKLFYKTVTLYYLLA